MTAKKPRIILDGFFFQVAKTGIARLWKSYLEQWAGTDLAVHLIVLDRNHSAPRIPGISYLDVPEFDWNFCGREMLQIEDWCQELRADVFISTFYSSPIKTTSVMMVHDMIMELNSDGTMDGLGQEEKSLAILQASHFVAISHNTSTDLRACYPYLTEKDVSVVPSGVDPIFQPAEPDRITTTKEKYGLKKPYFLLVGTRKGFRGYKNAIFLVRTLDRMKQAADFEVVCVGGEPALEELATFKNISVRLLPHVSDDDLIALYSGAEALVYPSRWEGFGLPIIEAMACGCPVITCPNGSIPEVAGDAALFVGSDDVTGLEAALLRVGDPLVRSQMKSKGIARSLLFSWKRAADRLAEILLQAASLPEKSAKEVRIWQEFREHQQRLAPLVDLGRKVSPRQLKLRLGNYSLEIGVFRS